MDKQEEKQFKSGKKVLSNYTRYSGMAFQMIAIIGIFVFIGYKIDESQNSDKLFFTAILGVAGVGASLYTIIRSLKNNS